MYKKIKEILHLLLKLAYSYCVGVVLAFLSLANSELATFNMGLNGIWSFARWRSVSNRFCVNQIQK